MPRTDAVPRAAVPEFRLLFHVPLKVFEADLDVLRDGGVELVYIIIDALVHRLDAPGDQHLPLELLGVVDADEAF